MIQHKIPYNFAIKKLPILLTLYFPCFCSIITKIINIIYYFCFTHNPYKKMHIQ
ncbi:hypothetical protein BMW23_0081 [Bodo saltans virus]|uniref:Uncharacterized protein n=1 Tax=Bodo saltans virus TaxID=2024608 RepID=A0A2H4UT72_9VIRU|nr:hypothetical protein QJ851_gp0080 [Bodo saltans virus]ATZ80143.1 hypothetical protein BMW23_0081 [Bodo saltans virus]